MNLSTVVEHSVDHRGCTSSRCPVCKTLFVYWDEEDLDDEGNLRCYCLADAPQSICRWCQREILYHPLDGWINPDADGDDVIWRETCEAHDTFIAEHEPTEDE